MCSFLQREFSPRKAEFLINHGEWLHQGNKNRFALVLDEKVIGYFGIIPTKVYWNDSTKNAIWWIDLIISKEYRGKGYQSIVDDYIQNRPEIKLGFPNKFAAKIHKKHHWYVSDYLKVMLFPILPSKSSIVSKKYSSFGTLLNILVTPLKYYRSHSTSKWSYQDNKPELERYVELYNISHNGYNGTYKDLDYLKWRYLDSPFKHEYNFYFCNKNQNTQIALILRKVQSNKGIHFRIMDVFGHIEDRVAFRDIMKLVISNAIEDGATQITIMESNSTLQKVLFSLGFIFFTKARFCYLINKNQPETGEKMRWTLSDSDNDFLD